MSFGFGSSSSLSSVVSESSSSMISLQRSMHSSQMYTPGPAMSFLTCFWDFPQNEHFSRSPPSPNFATRCSQLQEPIWLRPYFLCTCDRGHLRSLFQCRTTGDDLVDYTVGLCLFRRHDEVSV